MITLLVCGDVGVKRTDCHSIFHGVRAYLRNADLCFAQLETAISARGAKAPNARLAMRAPPAMAAAVRAAGISAMSFAGNHCLDYGYEALDDTLQIAAAEGIGLCGAGADLAAARRPLVLEVSGVRVAILAVSSILPEGYAADGDKPGCAPLRAHTLYEPIESDQPGTPPRIRSFAHRGDLSSLLHAVEMAGRAAEVVLVSLHWGIHMVRSVLADYQVEVAHACIDAGAAAIVGHHPHVLKGVEIYRERPIFYSLGNFAIEQPHIWDPAITRTASFRHLVSLNPQWSLEAPYMLPEITRMSGIAKLLIANGRVEARFKPAWITDDCAPQALNAADPRFAQVEGLLRDSCSEAGLATTISRAGDELCLSG